MKTSLGERADVGETAPICQHLGGSSWQGQGRPARQMLAGSGIACRD